MAGYEAYSNKGNRLTLYMNVTYIHHIGFLIETESCYYLIDYFQCTIPALNPCKPVLVLASHKPHDHYQKSVFSILRDMGMQNIHAVLYHYKGWGLDGLPVDKESKNDR